MECDEDGMMWGAGISARRHGSCEWYCQGRESTSTLKKMVDKELTSHLGDDAAGGGARASRALEVRGDADFLASDDAAGGGTGSAGTLVVGGDVDLGDGGDGDSGEGVHCKSDKMLESVV